MRMYRVLLHDENAAPGEPGGVLYIPPQGSGRIDNSAYETLYVGDSPAGCCAEVFNRGAHRTHWTPAMLPLRRYPHLKRSLAWYEIDDGAILNLDDPQPLLDRALRPSQIIARDTDESQRWALAIFNERRYAGVQWWSFHDARWKSAGIWDRSVIRSYGVDALKIDDPAIEDAARILQITLSLTETRGRKR